MCENYFFFFFCVCFFKEAIVFISISIVSILGLYQSHFCVALFIQNSKQSSFILYRALLQHLTLSSETGGFSHFCDLCLLVSFVLQSITWKSISVHHAGGRLSLLRTAWRSYNQGCPGVSFRKKFCTQCVKQLVVHHCLWVCDKNIYCVMLHQALKIALNIKMP